MDCQKHMRKKNNPLRPIISNCDIYNYNVAKFLTNLLSPYSRSDYCYVKDFFEFAEFIRQRQISNAVEMVSFDVKSLFANVPINKTIDIIIKDLYRDNKLKTVTKTIRNNMLKLVKIDTKSSFHMQQRVL